jgi:RNA polymerase sigma-70 factor (sigma-E family)
MQGMKTGPEFDDFVRLRSSALLRTAYALAGDYGHAEDKLQTALLRTARHWAKAREAPAAYVRKVLLSLCHDRWRWLRRRPQETPLADNAAAPVPAAIDATGERSSLIQALKRLPQGQRQVIVLRFLEDQSVAQTAELLGISAGTVRSYTARALASLRALLDDFCDDEAASCRGTTEVLHAH